MVPHSLFRQLFDFTPAVVLEVDRVGRVVDCNRTACFRLARTRKELVGKPVLALIAPGDRPRSRAQFLQAFQGRRAIWQAQFQRGDGLVRSFTLRTLNSGQDESPERVLVLADEVEVDPPGRPETAQLHRLLENLPGQFSAVLDPEGHIRYAAGVARTFWEEDGAWLGRPFEQLLARGEDAVRLLVALRSETSQGREWNGAMWFRRPDGSTFPAHVFASPYRESRTQAVVGTLVIGRDTSAEHEAREAVARAERFARIGELVASLARELQVPLAELERCGTGPGGADALARIRRMTDALAAFTSPRPAAREPVPVDAVLHDVLESMEPELAEAGIRVQPVTFPSLPDVFVDRDQLAQVLRTLLDNARDALVPGGGSIRILADRSASGVVLSVADNGHGIEAGWEEKVFEPFFTTREGRLGLGLAIARGIVSAYGGRIWLGRRDDGWTRFHLDLPAEPPAHTIAFRPVPLVLRRVRSVLVIDDDTGTRGMIRKFLERVGYEVHEAWSGRSALAHLTSGARPDIVITDLRMADGTGFWFLGRLRNDFPELLARTIIITGDSSSAAVEDLHAETGCPIVRKPFDLTTLLETMDQVAARTRK